MRLELTKKFTNEIHGIIVDNGLNPNLFRWEVTGSDFNTHTVEDRYGPLTSRQEPDSVNSLAIKIDEQPYFFTFDQQHSGKYCTSMRPSIERGDKVRVDSRALLLVCFEEWLSIIKYELEEPDLWKTSFANVVFTDVKNYRDKTTYSESDAQQIKGMLKDIVARLESVPNFGSERVEKLEESFAYLEEKLDEHVSKIDFKHLLVSTLLHIYVATWIVPFSDDFRDAVMQGIRPLLKTLFEGLALHG